MSYIALSSVTAMYPVTSATYLYVTATYSANNAMYPGVTAKYNVSYIAETWVYIAVIAVNAM